MENILLLDTSDDNQYALKFEEGRADEVLALVQNADIANLELIQQIDHILSTYFDFDDDCDKVEQDDNDNDNDPTNDITYNNEMTQGNTKINMVLDVRIIMIMIMSIKGISLEFIFKHIMSELLFLYFCTFCTIYTYFCILIWFLLSICCFFMNLCFNVCFLDHKIVIYLSFICDILIVIYIVIT